MSSISPSEGDTTRPIEAILGEIETIDVSLIDTRFKSPDLDERQIVDKLSQLLVQRNKLVDELSKARAKEFHDFISSLNFQELQITPFFPVPRRCKLQLNNPISGELIKAHEDETPTNPWKKMLSSFMKKKEEEKHNQTQTAITSLQKRQQNIIMEKKNEIQNEISRLQKKPILSPTDIALKVRLQSELDELEKFEIGKRKAK
ncbi:hypothetical protein M9Y10_002245 [Tritrichomonas musculus]|uniref:Uncharacterized protein n=1 Tax=Tritrichomonas musculus TaxID=1915356 RepID=A0ABR2L9N5_9EUKA